MCFVVRRILVYFSRRWANIQCSEAVILHVASTFHAIGFNIKHVQQVKQDIDHSGYTYITYSNNRWSIR